MRRRILFALAALLLIMMLLSMNIALTAANIVEPSGLSETVFPILASQLAPPECDNIRNSLASIVVCTGGNCNGSKANDLILGTSSYDNIDGKNGDDCVVGAAGNDDLNGGNGNDFLLGGPGNDVLDGGRKKDNDTCYGGGGTNTYVECDITY